MVKIIISTIPMFVCAFWCINLLLESKDRNKPKIFLAFFMFIACLLYLGHAAYFNRDYGFYSFWESIYLFCSLSVYPLYFLYIKLISKKNSLTLKDFWVLIPAFLMMVYSFFLYAKMSPAEHDFYTTQMLYDKNFTTYPGLSQILMLQLLKSKIFTALFLLEIIPVVYFGRKYILEYNRRIKNYYSNTEGKILQHFNNLLYIFTGISLLSGIFDIIGKSVFVNSNYVLLIPSLLFGFFLFAIGYLGYKQDFTLETFIKDVKREEDKLVTHYKASVISNDYSEITKEKLMKELIKLLKEEEIYKQSDLKITDISRQLNTNRTYISRLVNEELKTNFSDLVNCYRIEHAKKLLNGNDYRTHGLSLIGEMSGFKSNSSFYRIFKEKEGISPGDYRKKKCQECSDS